jgi:hypothetical protein
MSLPIASKRVAEKDRAEDRSRDALIRAVVESELDGGLEEFAESHLLYQALISDDSIRESKDATAVNRKGATTNATWAYSISTGAR